MCKTVMRFVEEFHVDRDCPLVNYLLAEDWNQVSAFFRGVVDGENVGRFIGKKDEEFFGYARNVMSLNNLIASPQRVHARRAQPADDYVQHVRPVRIPAKMVMPVVVGVLALMCLLYVGVNMVGTGQRSEKKAEESSLEVRFKKSLEEQAKQARLIEAQGEIIKKLDGRVTSLAGSQAHVDAERSRKLQDGLVDLAKKGDACVQKVTENLEGKLKAANERAEDLAQFYATNKIATDDLGLVLKTQKTEAEKIQENLTSIQDQVKPLKTQVDQTDSRSKDMRVKVDMISDDLSNNFYVYVSLLALVVCFCGAVVWFVKSSVVYMDHSITSFHKKYNDHLELLTGSHGRFQIIENRLEAVENILAARDHAPRAEQGSFEDNQDAAPVPAGPGRVRARKGAK